MADIYTLSDEPLILYDIYAMYLSKASSEQGKGSKWYKLQKLMIGLLGRIIGPHGVKSQTTLNKAICPQIQIYK